MYCLQNRNEDPGKKVESSTLRAYQAQRSVFTNQNLPNVIFSPMALFT